MSGAQRWRSQSLIGHEHFTGPQSHADTDGFMPAYAEHAYQAASAACHIAGLAKKHWRDGSAAPISIEVIRAQRDAVNKALDALEASLADGTSRESLVVDVEAADAAFRAHGRLGYLALATMEEAAELAKPLHDLATGIGDPAENLKEAAHESADVRTYLHVSCESLGINPVTSSDEKWAIVQARWPGIFSTARARPATPIDMKKAVAPLLESLMKDKK